MVPDKVLCMWNKNSGLSLFSLGDELKELELLKISVLAAAFHMIFSFPAFFFNV